MVFQGLDAVTARTAWAELSNFVAAHPADYIVDEPLLVAALPAAKLWDGDFRDAHMPGAITRDTRSGANG